MKTDRCPMCGDSLTALSKHDDRYFVMCTKCGLNGRKSKYKWLAAHYWNKSSRRMRKIRKHHLIGREW